MRSLSSLIATRATAVLGVALLLAARSPSVDATAKVLDATGRELGVLTLVDAGAAIAVTGTLRGLTPGVHGVHLHTVGRCDGPDSPAPARTGARRPSSTAAPIPMVRIMVTS